MPSIIIRDAGFEDVEKCQLIETSASKRFLSSDIEEIKQLVDGVVLNPESLVTSIKDNLCFISEINGEDVGFIMLKQFSNSWYIEEISVVEHAQSQGVGNALLSYVKMLAEVKSIISINLITFKDVAWNMPYYQRKGYKVMAEENLSVQFLQLWHADNQYFNPKLRICMQLKIDLDKF